MPEFIQKNKGLQAGESYLKKESKDRRLNLPHIKTCLKVITLKPELYEHKNKQNKVIELRDRAQIFKPDVQ